MLRKLSFRVAVLIIVLGPSLLITGMVLGTVYIRLAQPHTRLFLMLAELGFVVIGIPLILGLIASHYIAEPIHEFSAAIARLRESNYAVRLPKGDIQEFDRLTEEFNRLSRQLAKEEELRRTLISDTSHELNTPLAALGGQVRGMRDGVLAVTPERLELLSGQVERLGVLVAGLQEYAGIRAHAVRPALEKVELDKVVGEIAELYAGELRERGITLERDLREGTVTADRRLLAQLLINLVSNAIRHSQGSRITVASRPGSLNVRDNGRGIAAEHLPHVFERFYRVDSSRSRQSGGLGLGLAIAREIAEAHGWQLAARPEHPGVSFIITVS